MAIFSQAMIRSKGNRRGPKVSNGLVELVTQATRLRLIMRMDLEHVVYIFSSPPMDDLFDTATAIMTNLEEMERTRPSRLDASDLQRLVKISTFLKVTAYRKDVLKHNDKAEGFHRCRLTKGFAHFNWGQPMSDSKTGPLKPGPRELVPPSPQHQLAEISRDPVNSWNRFGHGRWR
jgi:hypothetical protein